ncbi:MAG: enoyl-CoA hydratase-related protein [Polaromonas sp.]|nr:enoyl-CoA hydratase-related protein [Polaromonas sp.]
MADADPAIFAEGFHMDVEFVRHGSIATIKLNRPDKYNAVNEPMKKRLAEVFAELRLDDGVRAIILAGNGSAFCTGGDVSTMGNFSPKSLEVRLRTTHKMLLEIDAIEKPVIASVRGAVAGIGWSMAMVCDQIVASETAYFSQSFKNVGVIPDGGALYFLTQNIGVLRVKDLVLSGRRLPAQEALQLGLVTKLVPDDRLEEETLALAQDLADGPTLAYGIGKKLLKQVCPSGLGAFLDSEMWAQTVAVLSDDHKEGAQAFREKRKPVFKGR